MKFLTFFRVLILISAISIASCGDDDYTTITQTLNVSDYSEQIWNQPILVPLGNGWVRAMLSKPQGDSMDMVLVLHGGSATYEDAVHSTLVQATKWDGGNQFLLRGYAILALDYTEFANAQDTIGVTKGVQEMEEVIAAVNFLSSDPFINNGFYVEKLFAFGHSRGGGNALLAAIETEELVAVVSTEAPLNWKAVRDSIASCFLKPDSIHLSNFYATTADWNIDTSLWTKYSPSLRYQEFNSPFLVINGELDTATFVAMAEDLNIKYQNCGTDCVDGSRIFIHPRGHTDWATPAILDSIHAFFQAQ